MGCIDMNAWSSRVDLPHRPDWVMFDLDPAGSVGFAEVIEVALLVKQALDLLGLDSYPKTSGSRGIHVLVPIARRHTYEEPASFALRRRGCARAGALRSRDDGVGAEQAPWRPRRRQPERPRPRTTATVYSVRPRAGAPVSTPLRGTRCKPGLDPAAFTMDAVLDRVASDGDLFAGVLGGKQSLTGRSSACASAEQRETQLEAFDHNGDGRTPVGPLELDDGRRHRRPRGAARGAADGAVAELLETRLEASLPSSQADSATSAPRPRKASSSTAARISVPSPRRWKAVPSHEPVCTRRVSAKPSASKPCVPASRPSAQTSRFRVGSPGRPACERVGGRRGSRRRSGGCPSLSVQATANGISSGGWIALGQAA